MTDGIYRGARAGASPFCTCGAPIPANHHAGRPRRFCSVRCRVAAHRDRLKGDYTSSARASNAARVPQGTQTSNETRPRASLDDSRHRIRRSGTGDGGRPMTERPITSISIGRRHRRDLGDIVALANSIREVGLLHPPVITPGGELIAGERRIEAAKSLGWESIPVRIVDIDGIARGELAENAYRKDFTPSEMVAIAATVEDQERELARQRMTLGKISTGSESGKTRDKVAAPLGISGRTLQKATAVVQAAEQEPERFRRLVEEMDRTGKVERFHAELVRVRAADQAAREIPGGIDGIDARVITGDYRTKLGDEVADSSVDLIFTDPPWHRNEVHQYGDLAEWAARKLVDGGSLICYAGNFALPEILPLMVPHVRYWWTLAVFHGGRSEEHTSELQSRRDLVCRLLLEKKKKQDNTRIKKKKKKINKTKKKKIN